jgi:hypothetical protein
LPLPKSCLPACLPTCISACLQVIQNTERDAKDAAQRVEMLEKEHALLQHRLAAAKGQVRWPVRNPGWLGIGAGQGRAAAAIVLCV